MSWEAITDPSNPFNTKGLSREVSAMLDVCLAAKTTTGLDVVVSSTTDHPVNTASGNPSRHRLPGTDGEGLAIDCRLRQRGNDIHGEVFRLFKPYEKRLHELIYASATYNIRSGQRVSPYARSSHHDHVHLSVDRGVFLVPPSNPVPLPKEEPMPRFSFAKTDTSNAVHLLDREEFTRRVVPDLETWKNLARIYEIAEAYELVTDKALNFFDAKGNH